MILAPGHSLKPIAESNVAYTEPPSEVIYTLSIVLAGNTHCACAIVELIRKIEAANKHLIDFKTITPINNLKNDLFLYLADKRTADE